MTVVVAVEQAGGAYSPAAAGSERQYGGSQLCVLHGRHHRAASLSPTEYEEEGKGER